MDDDRQPRLPQLAMWPRLPDPFDSDSFELPLIELIQLIGADRDPVDTLICWADEHVVEGRRLELWRQRNKEERAADGEEGNPADALEDELNAREMCEYETQVVLARLCAAMAYALDPDNESFVLKLHPDLKGPKCSRLGPMRIYQSGTRPTPPPPDEKPENDTGHDDREPNGRE